MSNRNSVIEKVCQSLMIGEVEQAKLILQNDYPFQSVNRHPRQYSNYQKMKVFLRDGFIDRYSGEKLVCPPVLRIVSKELPDEFPFHKNWKMSECHLAYWQLIPTIDHIIPIARGGKDEESNWICTSQLRNNAKSYWLLEELGWRIYPPGKLDEWDGLTNWFIEYRSKNPKVLEDRYIAEWSSAIDRAINT